MKAGSIIALIGGILILIVAIGVLALGSLFAGAASILGVGGLGALAMIPGILGLISGIIVIVCAVMAKPGKEVMFGVLALVFSIIGFFGGGGLYIGSILGIVGGALIIAKK
jgi:hypothetical protein